MKINKGLGDQKGAVVVITAICLVVMVAITGLAVDLGHLYSIKSELQRAVDAGALAGAGELFPSPSNPPDPEVQYPNCAGAQSTATEIAKINKVKAFAETDILVISESQTGVWDFKSTPPTFDANCSSSPGSLTNAVRLTAKMDNVPVSLIGILGSGPVTVTENATAATDFFNGQVPAGGGFPWAITKQCYEENKNKDDSSNRFTLNSINNKDGRDGINIGQWTSFVPIDNNANTTKKLIQNGSPIPLNLTDSFYIQPGDMASLFKDALDYRANQTVILPVLNTGSNELEEKKSYPVLKFMPFYIIDADNGKKTIEGYFQKKFILPGSKPGGPPSNILSPPRLVK